MNQYRCNNGCSHLVNYDFCSVVQDYVCEDEENWIGKIGCASHSDFQNQIERVLDKLLNRVNNISETADLSCHDGYTGGMYSTDVIRISYLEEEMEKFRQSKDGEP
jgi:hypothetical protein